MKLGLKIEITSQGAGSAALTYNSTPALDKYASASRSFIKEVFPVREDLKLKGLDPLTSLDESSHSVVFLRLLGPDGLLICVFQARPENSGRPYDGAAAWIHIPASVVLSGSETEKLIDEVKAAISGERGIDYPRLDVLFTKEYEKKNLLPAISSIGSNGSTFGIRYFGPGTNFQLNKLLGNIAQPVYGNYKAVFFLSKDDAIAVTAPEITTPLTPTCIMSAPTPIAGYNAFFESGRPFNVDLEYPLNAPIKVVWKKRGYQDIVKTANAKAGDSNEIANLFIMSKTEVKVAIKKQIFNVIGSGYQLGKYQITIDGNLLDNVLYIQEDKLAKGVNVKVEAEGFETYSKNHMLTVDTQRVDISLKKQSYIYKFAIPMYIEGKRIDNGLVSIELNQKIDECPIKGYSLVHEHISEGNVNRLERNNFKETLKHFLYGFFTCVGIIAAVRLYNVVEDIDDVKFQFGWPLVMHSSTQSNSGQVQQQDPVDKDQDAEQTDSLNNDSSEMAIAYLNSIDVWNSDSIAKYSYLEGLFEALNDYKYDELVNTWASRLKDVPNFNKVVQAATLAKNAGWNPRQGIHNNPTYNTVDDKKISLTNYINWISADQTPKQETPKTQTAGSHIKPITTPKKTVTPPATPANDKTKKNKGGKI